MRTPVALAILVLALSGCSSQTSEDWSRLGQPAPATDAGERVLTLWRGSWLAAMIVGVLVWGLIFYACIVFRRRHADDDLPMQVRYNLPVEMAYTLAPLIIVAVFYTFTARDTNAITDIKGEARHHVEVVGMQWSWNFNYKEEGVYETGTPAERPLLMLPVNEPVEFSVTSRDVVHSFWVPAFLYKLDAFPGVHDAATKRNNRFEVRPKRVGTFAGKCAELCGYNHSRMLFQVKIVPRAEYDAYIANLKAKGQTGDLPATNGPASQINEGDSGTPEGQSRP